VAKSSQSRVKAEVEKPSRPDTRVWGAPCSPEQMFLAISALVSKFQPGSYVSVRVRLCRGLVGKWYEFISENKKKKKKREGGGLAVFVKIPLSDGCSCVQFF